MSAPASVISASGKSGWRCGHLGGELARLDRIAAPERQRGEAIERDQIAGVDRQRRLEVAPRRVEPGQRDQSGAAIGQRRREAGIGGQRRAELGRRLLVPAEPEQVEAARVEDAGRIGRRRLRPIEQSQRLVEPPLPLAPPGDEAQHHDMVDALAERVLGHLAGARRYRRR